MDPARKLFALLVGIDEYAHADIPSLSGCVKDVETLKSALLRRYPAASIISLTNQDATRAAIIQTFRSQLSDNAQISSNDAMLFYFAGYGKRFAAQPDLPRDADALLPCDYGPTIAGIFDASLDGLLRELTDRKGPNATLILDCSFSQRVATSSVRRIKAPFWSSHLSSTGCQVASPLDHRGLFTASLPYVLLSAGHQDAHCTDSANGGLFTQALISGIEASWPLSCRELIVHAQRALEEQQAALPMGYGQHLDRVFFAVPQLHPIEKLRVFAQGSELGVEREDGVPHNTFCLVARKHEAEIAVRASTEGRAIIERLRSPIARYGSPELSVDCACLPQVLDGIAYFHHFLALGPANPGWVQSLWSRVGTLLGWGLARPPRPFVELYHYKEEKGRKPALLGQVSSNILQDGVADLAELPRDHVLGLKITNESDKEVYPYVLNFDSETYAINVLYSPFPKGGKGPPRWLKPHASLVFGHAPEEKFSWANLASLRIVPNKSGERTAEIFKILLSEKPIEFGYMQQASPMSTPREQVVPEEIPGVWRTETVTLIVPANYGR
ncbi:hypothetical protein HMN09_00203600 [Mycena chlorophos]|uniref:Peptidase C14 caspase domain-containing protein n=1 Tax=Mycena chlorophos TaxID=658473 RepID=A0A8H6TLE7_MYCCL|nr:hypothetical protein HMN09_00203600 [Mycena chlorophos]